MNEKKHKILDHPILGYFILMIFAMVVTSIVSLIIDTLILANFIPGYATEIDYMGSKISQASGIGNAIGSILVIGIFYMRFRPSFDGMLKKKNFLIGIMLLAPILVIHWIGSIVSWTEFGTASVFLAFLKAMAPGFGEETTFRGPGVANYLRRKPTEKGVLTIFWISSIVFGMVHISNSLVGAPLKLSLIQAAYAMGIGMVLAAVYLRTGCLWPCIFGHMSLDFMEFVRNDLGNAGGVMSNMGIGDWITIAAGVLGAVWGLYLIRSAKRTEIVDLWKSKWSI